MLMVTMLWKQQGSRLYNVVETAGLLLNVLKAAHKRWKTEAAEVLDVIQSLKQLETVQIPGLSKAASKEEKQQQQQQLT